MIKKTLATVMMISALGFQLNDFCCNVTTKYAGTR